MKYALIIGTGNYSDLSFPKLVKPELDVQGLVDVLRDKEIGGFDDVTPLFDKSVQNVREAIETLCNEKKHDDLLLLYFSGHGILDAQGRLYFAMMDTRRSLLGSTAIPSSYALDRLNNSNSRRQVLVLDCCHSGAFARTKGAIGDSVGTIAAFDATGFGRVVLTATDSIQYAWEDNQFSGQIRESVFTHHFIQGLKTGLAASNEQEEFITLNELYQYVQTQVRNETPNQTPLIHTYDQMGEIAIARNLRRKPSLPVVVIKSGKRVLNCLPSRNPERDWSVESARDIGLFSASPVIPHSVDLRADWWKISNQGYTGEGVGWAAADGILRWHFVLAGRLDRNELLSPWFICAAAQESVNLRAMPTKFVKMSGISLKSALDIARKYGVVTESDLPNDKSDLSSSSVSAFYGMAATRKIASYYSLRRPLISIPANEIVSTFQQWLATKGPILVRLVVDKTFERLVSDRSGKLDTYKPYPPEKSGGHAVAIVGYTPTRFIIRNSWGTNWGNMGYAYASHQYTIAAITEAYGVII